MSQILKRSSYDFFCAQFPSSDLKNADVSHQIETYLYQFILCLNTTLNRSLSRHTFPSKYSGQIYLGYMKSLHYRHLSSVFLRLLIIWYQKKFQGVIVKNKPTIQKKLSSRLDSTKATHLDSAKATHFDNQANSSLLNQVESTRLRYTDSSLFSSASSSRLNQADLSRLVLTKAYRFDSAKSNCFDSTKPTRLYS